MRTIAIERVRDELFKILITPNAAAAMKLIYDNDILAYFLPKSRRLDALERLSKLVEDMRFEGSFLRRLFVLYQPTQAKAENMANTLRYTKKQKEIFVRWAKIDVKPEKTFGIFYQKYNTDTYHSIVGCIVGTDVTDLY